MREGWRETQLGDVVAINPEATTGISPRKSIRYIDLSSVSRERGIDSSAVNSMAFADAPGRARRVVRSHDVLIATVRPYLRGFAMVSPVWDGEIASTGFAVLRAREGMIRPEFVWACVSTDGFVEHLMQRATGSNYPAIRPGDIASYPIHLPPLSEQRRIVDLVAALDETIAAADTLAGRGRASREALLAEILRNPRGDWIDVTVSEIASFASGYSFPPALQGRGAGEWPVFKVSDMNTRGNERLLTKCNNWVDDDDLRKMKARIWPKGTVVFPKVGAALLTEKRRMLGRPGAFDNNVMGLVAGELILPEYLLLAMEGVRLAELAQNGAVPSVNQSHLAGVAIPLPSLAEQRRIVTIAAAFDVTIAAADALADRGREARSTLLADLLSGEHEIPESYDRLLEGVS